MRKLIRDRIPEIMRREGLDPHVYALDNDFEYAKELAIKLSEEMRELVEANTPEQILEESADVLEVLTSIVKVHGYNLGDLLTAQRTKYHEKGGFDNRLVLEGEKTA